MKPEGRLYCKALFLAELKARIEAHLRRRRRSKEIQRKADQMAVVIQNQLHIFEKWIKRIK